MRASGKSGKELGKAVTEKAQVRSQVRRQVLLASKDHECGGQVKVTGRAKRSIGIAAGQMVGVTDGVT